MKRTYSFSGKMKTLSPITVSLPEIKGLPRNGNRQAGAAPYFPATSIRGAFRHAAHKVALRYMKKKTGEERPLSVDEHFMLAQGVDTASNITDPADRVDENRRVREINPLLSVFGRWGLESKLDVGNAFPVSDGVWCEFGSSARGIVFERNESLVDHLKEEDQDRLKAILLEQAESSVFLGKLRKQISEQKKQARIHLQANERDQADQCYKRIEKIEADMKLHKEEKTGSKEAIRRPIEGYEAFRANSELSHRMFLTDATDIELGFILKVLAEFAREPFLGGHRASGCGHVEFEWDIKTWMDDDTWKPKSIGTVNVGFDGIRIHGQTLLDAISTYEQGEFDFSIFSEDQVDAAA